MAQPFSSSGALFEWWLKEIELAWKGAERQVGSEEYTALKTRTWNDSHRVFTQRRRTGPG
jgi:hypothetical protein